jgi:hypothetical protein
MNAVERLLHYTELPREGETTGPNDPPASWPDQGRISFTDVKLAYREGLPLVLKGVTFDVKPGEKVSVSRVLNIAWGLVLMSCFGRLVSLDVLEQVRWTFRSSLTLF